MYLSSIQSFVAKPHAKSVTPHFPLDCACPSVNNAHARKKTTPIEHVFVDLLARRTISVAALAHRCSLCEQVGQLPRKEGKDGNLLMTVFVCPYSHSL